MSRLQTPVRRNDTVIVIAGKDRGKRGRVLKLLPERNRVVVEGVNFIKRHTRPNPSRNIKGGVVEREASLHGLEPAARVPGVWGADAGRSATAR